MLKETVKELEFKNKQQEL